jgi:hypothetical protein
MRAGTSDQEWNQPKRYEKAQGAAKSNKEIGLNRFRNAMILCAGLLTVSGLFAQNAGASAPLLVPGVTTGVPEIKPSPHPSQENDASSQPRAAASSESPGNSSTNPIAAAGTPLPKDSEKPIPFDSADLGGEWIKFDRNGDGRTDYAVRLDEWGHKVREALDFNFDGYFDDFLYYQRGVLVREEIDSNYDRRVDIWIYVTGGIYVERIEQDTNFDGIPDRIKDYGKKH